MENDLDKQIADLREQIIEHQQTTQKQSEVIKLKKQLEQLKFRKKHSGILNFTNKLEKGTIGFFKSIPKMAEALNKSDAWVEKAQKAEQAQSKVKKEKNMKDSIRESLDTLD